MWAVSTEQGHLQSNLFIEAVQVGAMAPSVAEDHMKGYDTDVAIERLRQGAAIKPRKSA